MSKIYLGLVHFPVLNKKGAQILTSISNPDIHDIARAACSYGVEAYYIVHPEPGQKQLLDRIISFWQHSKFIAYNPHRSQALSIVRQSDTIADLIEEITTQEKMRPIIITTTARFIPKQISHRYLRTLTQTPQPVLILFGTGYGLSNEVHNLADHILEPISGGGDYNHLSVRSAAAIVLDRISSETIYGRNHGYSAHSWQRPNQNRLSRISRGRYGEGPL